MHRFVSALCLLLAFGCSEGSTLIVDLRTDLVAGEEFSGIRTELVRGTAPTGLDESLATFGTDYVSGARIFEASGLESGSYAITVRLLDGDGSVVAQRRVTFDVDGDLAFAVVIKRDAAACEPSTCGVTETCGLDGCTDERCIEELGEFCPAPDCEVAADCEERDSCSERVCVFGRCLYGSADGACGTGTWCDPDLGCRPRTGSDGDGGLDAGPDASPDAGSCPSGTADCDGDPANGCEQDVSNDIRNCGACGRRCDGAGGAMPVCSAGVCGVDCPDGTGDCDGDPANGCEADVTIDPNNCALCGSVCPAGLPICVESDCTANPFPSDGSEGAFEPAEDTVLPSGIHHFTTITIPAGVMVTTDGTGVLELYAQGDVMIDGVIDLSGGDGGLATGGSAYQQGGGGSTGTAIDGEDGISAVCRPGGAGGVGPGGADARSVNVICGEGGRAGGGAGGGNGGGGGGGGAAGGAGGHGPTALGGAGGSLPGNMGGVPAMDGVGVGAEPGLPVYGGGDSLAANQTSGGGGGSIGMEAVMDLAAATTFRPGSGGGGGGGRTSPGTESGTGGGGGGGALRIASATSITTGVGARLLVSGGDGGDMGGVRGLGGGGSGGLVYLAAPEVMVMGEIDASGGLGGRSATGDGGNGGLGRIRISAIESRCAILGALTPPMMTFCTPTNELEFTYVGAYPD